LSPLDLIGRVAARRLRESTDARQGRAFFCIVGLPAPVVTAIARHVAKETSPWSMETSATPSSRIRRRPGTATTPPPICA
jgi:hypothetical protein